MQPSHVPKGRHKIRSCEHIKEKINDRFVPTDVTNSRSLNDFKICVKVVSPLTKIPKSSASYRLGTTWVRIGIRL